MDVTGFAVTVAYEIECVACGQKHVDAYKAAPGMQLPRPSLPEGWMAVHEVMGRSVALFCPKHKVEIECFVDGVLR